MISDDIDTERLLLKRIPEMIRESATTKKLLLLLERKSRYHGVMQNEFDELEEQFVSDLEEKIDLFERQCKPILEERIPVPAPIRNKSNELLLEMEEGGRRQVTTTRFVSKMENAIENILNDGNEVDIEHDIVTPIYRGLDSDRDTDEEVENICRMYPKLLKDLPKVFRCANIRSVSFIPKIAQLRMELCDDLDGRGGLLTRSSDGGGYNVLQNLVCTPYKCEDTQLAESRFLAVLKRLKETGLFVKEDIQAQALLHLLCINGQDYFPEKRFRFISDWDSVALTQPNPNLKSSDLPLHHAANWLQENQGFQVVLEATIRHFPREKGIHILFQNNGAGQTPFELACQRMLYTVFGNLRREELEKAAIRVLPKFPNFQGKRCDSDFDEVVLATVTIIAGEEVLRKIERVLTNFPGDPYDTVEALLSAANNERISLDCVYFILRREPDVLAKLL